MDRMSSIELAIKNEQTEMDYYMNESNRSKNPLAKAIFQTLANDEKEHMTRLRNLHQKLIADGSWPEEAPIEVADTNIKDVLKNMVEQVGSHKDHDDDDLAALNRGADFEANGAKFYLELAVHCDNPQEKRFFNFLAGIEREHLLSIKDSIFYLEDPEGWLESHEHQGLDGA